VHFVDREVVRRVGSAVAKADSVDEVGTEFGRILSGMMANRRLTVIALSRASERAEATINRILAGITAPSAAVLHDLAPALRLPVADLFVIAGLPAEQVAERPGAYETSREIDTLVAVAGWLSPEQVQQVTALAHQLKATKI
jgi:transcriptional regulator with XRE-family HTH domain